MEKCQFCGKECKNFRSVATHIRFCEKNNQKLNTKEYYDKYLKNLAYFTTFDLTQDEIETLSHITTRGMKEDSTKTHEFKRPSRPPFQP